MCPTTRDAHWLGWHKVSMSSRHRSRLPVWCSPSRRVADIQCPWSVSHVVGLWSRYPWRLHAVALVWLARAVYHHEMGHQGRWTSTLFNGCHQTPRNTKGVRLPVPMFYSHTDNGLKNASCIWVCGVLHASTSSLGRTIAVCWALFALCFGATFLLMIVLLHIFACIKFILCHTV